MSLLNILRAQVLIPLGLFSVCLLLARYFQGKFAALTTVILSALFTLLAAFGALFGIGGHMLSSSLATTTVAYAHGQPIYHAASAADRYALLYGPLTYLLYLPPLLVSADLRAFQIWTILPACLTLFAIWLISKELRSRSARCLILLQAAVTLSIFAKFEWEPRADPWILSFCALGLLAAKSQDRLTALVGMSVAGAAIVDLKASTFLLACIPPLVHWTRSRKAGVALASVALIVPLSGLVFLLPRISLRNYLYWLAISSRHGLVGSQVTGNVLGVLTIFLPSLAIAGWLSYYAKHVILTELKRQIPLIVGVFAAAIGCVATGAKRGAGAWHCAPLIPIACLCSTKLLKATYKWGLKAKLAPMLRGAIAAVAFALSLLGLRYLRVTLAALRLGQPPLSADIATDLRDIVAANPGKDIEMGYGSLGSYELSWERSLLVAKGSRYTFDVDSISDMDLAGESLPPATIRYLDQCSADIWLIPKDEAPFTIRDFYSGATSAAPDFAFSEVLRRTFAAAYQKSSQSRFYDLYTCRRKQRITAAYEKTVAFVSSASHTNYHDNR